MLVEKDKKDEQCLAWARRLYDLLKMAGKLRTDPRKTGVETHWYSYFLLLKQERGPDKVVRVLTWLEANINGEFTPHAWSAKSFYEKFDQLLAAVERSSVVSVDDRSSSMAERYKIHFHFPVEVATRLPEVVQKTRENWRLFRASMKSMMESGGLKFQEQKFLEHVLVYSAPTFVDSWIESVSDRLRNHSHYTADVLRLAFHPGSEVFRDSFWHLWSLEYCANSRAFDKLLIRLIGS